MRKWNKKLAGLLAASLMLGSVAEAPLTSYAAQNAAFTEENASGTEDEIMTEDAADNAEEASKEQESEETATQTAEEVTEVVKETEESTVDTEVSTESETVTEEREETIEESTEEPEEALEEAVLDEADGIVSDDTVIVTYIDYTLIFKVNDTQAPTELYLTAYADITETAAYDVTIPATVHFEEKTLPVTQIGEKAFKGNKKLSKLLFEENSNITTIGKYAFSGCTNLCYVKYPTSLTNIGPYSFEKCTGLGKQDSADGAVSNPELFLPENLQILGEAAFSGCTALTKVTIPNTLNKVTIISAYNEKGPFYGCTKLTNIVIEEGTEVIPAHLFEAEIVSGSTQLSITIPDSVVTIGKDAFKGQTNMTECIISEQSKLTTISEYAFKGCTSLTTINFPEGLTTIGEEAFSECTKLSYVDFPSTLTTIGIRAFSGDKALGSQNADGEGVSETELVLPADIETIGCEAFQKCTSLKKVKIPKSIKTIKSNSYSVKGPFFSCDNLTDITIEEGMEVIPAHLFDGHIVPETKDGDGNFLYTINFSIPDSVAEIGAYAFRDQTNMVRCEIGENTKLKKIGNNAFSNCQVLEYIYLPEELTSIGESAFTDNKKLLIKEENGLATTTLRIPSEITKVNESTFEGCTSINEVIIPASVTSISSDAFCGCTGLKSVEFEVNNFYTHKQTLGYRVFKGCTALEHIQFGNKITEIPNSTFYDCTGLAEVEIPYGVKTISKDAFYNCNALRALFIPSSVKTINTTKSELAYCYEQGLKIYVEKGDSAAKTFAETNGFSAEVGIYVVEDEFPDIVLQEQVGRQEFDKNLDTRLTLRELEAVINVNVSGLGIADMTGTQLFTSMESLNCSDNQITELNTVTWTSLKNLNCSDNQLSVLNIEKTPLETLNCSNNRILAFDLSEVKTLTGVTLGEQKGTVEITYDDAYGEYVLPIKSSYSYYDKAKVSEVSDEEAGKPINEGLVWFSQYAVPDEVSYQYTEGFGMSDLTATASVTVTIPNAGITLTEKEYPDMLLRAKIMELVDTNKNGLISKTEERACTSLDVSGAEIENLKGIERLVNLKELICKQNSLTALDLSENIKLETLDCSENKLTAIKINGNSALVNLDCSNNSIKVLDTTGNPSLKSLKCANNKLSKLTLSSNPLLEILECGNNRLAAVDTTQNPALDTVRSGKQEFTALKENVDNKSYVGLKNYDESYNSALVSKVTAYVADSALSEADAGIQITEEGIFVQSAADKLTYQYTVRSGYPVMNVTVNLADTIEEEPEEPVKTDILTLAINEFSDKIYTGEETYQNVTIMDGEYMLRESKDYTVQYTNNVEVGTATVTLRGIGSYSGNYVGQYEIKPEWNITVKNIPNQVFRNKELTPALSVKDGRKLLQENVDYKAEYINNKDTGAATVILTGIGSYEQAGMKEVSFNIMECNISKTAITIPAVDYDGTAKEPAAFVQHNGLLVKGKDYTVSYSKNIKAGKAAIIFKGIGNYTGTVKKTFTIAKLNLEDLSQEEILVENQAVFSMTGAKPAVLVKKGEILLKEGVDYTLSYSGNKAVGNAKVTIKGKGSCKGKIEREFSVVPQSIADESIQIDVAVSQKDKDGKELSPKITIMQNKKKLREGDNKDYVISYDAEATKRSGLVSVTIIGKNNYTGETNADFVIVDKLITKAKVTGLETLEYDGTEKVQAEDKISVMLGGEEVPANCCKFSYENNVNCGNATIKITAMPENCNYEFGGTVSAKFKINGVKFKPSKEEERVTADLQAEELVYTGEKQYPDVIVMDEKLDVVLTENVDYKVTYANNEKVGNKGSVTIKGIGAYSGTIKLAFSILPKDMTEFEDEFKVVVKNSAYTGKNITPRVTVSDGETVLKANKDYRLVIEPCKEPEDYDGSVKERGRYMVTVNGIGNYTGQIANYYFYVY